MKSRCVDSKENFVFTLCNVESGYAHNVFPDKSFMQGTIRSYNKEALVIIKDKIKQIVESTASIFNCKGEVEFNEMYPPVINHVD